MKVKRIMEIGRRSEGNGGMGRNGCGRSRTTRKIGWREGDECMEKDEALENKQEGTYRKK